MKLHSKILLPVLLLMGIGCGASAMDEPAAVTDPKPAAEFRLAEFEGKVILVDFWASWCKPCRLSLPWLNEMQRMYGDQGLQVVMVNLDKDPAAASEMAAEIDSGIRQFLDPAGEMATRYELEGMPSSYLYDRSGELISAHVGFLKADGPKREKSILTALESEKN